MKKPIVWIAALILLCGLVVAYQGITATSRRRVLGFIPAGHKEEVDPLTTTAGLVVAAGGAVLLVRSMRKPSS